MNLSERIKLVVSTVLLIMISVVSPAIAQNECGFNSWDGDTSDYLDNEEFNMALVEVEYFDTWDADTDGYLSEEEWSAGVDEYLDAYEPDYNEWDADEDGLLSEDEFDNGLFDLVDDDDTDTIDQDEWDLFDEEEDGLFC